MTKFTLEIELANEKYCEGCMCLRIQILGDYCASLDKDLQLNVAGFVLRDKNCPLKEVKE
jgi:hypothetical protein